MGLERTFHRYLEFTQTSRTFLMSSPPPHSETLRLRGVKCYDNKQAHNLNTCLQPFDNETTYLLDFASQNTNKNWQIIPWNNNKPDLFKVFSALIPFMDDLPYRLDEQYIPKDEIVRVMKKFEESGQVLTVSNQLCLSEAKPNRIV